MNDTSTISSSSSKYGFYSRLKPFLAMIFLQFGVAGISIIGKFALNQGMNHYTFAVYRNVVATLVFAPFAFFHERRIRPKMTMAIFIKIAILAFLEPVVDQNLFYMGLKYTTATFSAAMCNILPALTFVMAWILRIEQVKIRRLHNQAKILGTIVTLGGAMIMTIVKGPALQLWSKSTSNDQIITSASQHPVAGAIMITIGCFCWASFVILQHITLKSYPAPLSLTTLICLTGAVEGAVVTVAAEWGNFAIWSIHLDSKLLSAVYSGVVCSGIADYIQGVVMEEKGPVFVTAFSPLAMVIVAIFGFFFLAEELYLGRVIGAAVIIAGLYLVVWGKSKDYQLPAKSTNHQDGINCHPNAALDNVNGTENSVKKVVLPTNIAV